MNTILHDQGYRFLNAIEQQRDAFTDEIIHAVVSALGPIGRLARLPKIIEILGDVASVVTNPAISLESPQEIREMFEAIESSARNAINMVWAEQFSREQPCYLPPFEEMDAPAYIYHSDGPDGVEENMNDPYTGRLRDNYESVYDYWYGEAWGHNCRFDDTENFDRPLYPDTLEGDDLPEGFFGTIPGSSIAPSAELSGDDRLVGDDDLADWIHGGDGDDNLLGRSGDDVLYGDGGNDRLLGEEGNDYVDGGTGDDRILGGSGADNLNGGDGADTLLGGAGSDILSGDAGDDRVLGGSGNDTVYGGSGDDRLFGDEGRDFMFGGAGNDVLFGGEGSDLFRYQSESGRDVVKDFEVGSDLIDLSAFGFASFEEVSDVLSQRDTRAVLNFGDGNRLVLQNVEASQLSAEDFVL